jgi:hypothetical protein
MLLHAPLHQCPPHDPAPDPPFPNPQTATKRVARTSGQRCEKGRKPAPILPQKLNSEPSRGAGAGTSVNAARGSKPPPPPSTRRRSLNPPPPATRDDSSGPPPSEKRRSPPSPSVPGPIPPYSPSSKKRTSSSGSSDSQSRRKSAEAGVDGKGHKAVLMPLELTRAEREEGQDKGVFERVGSSIAKVRAQALDPENPKNTSRGSGAA